MEHDSECFAGRNVFKTHELCDVGIIITSILYMMKLRDKEGKSLHQGHRAEFEVMLWVTTPPA